MNNENQEVKSILEALKREFEPEKVREREGPKKKQSDGSWVPTYFKYIPTSYVVERLDEVLPLAWSWENIEHKIYSFNKKTTKYIPDDSGKKQPVTTEVLVEHLAILGRLSINLPNGKTIFRDAWGGSELDKGSQAADAFKIASSNAFKKAALNFGIGLYLALDGLDEVEPKVEQHSFSNNYKSVQQKNNNKRPPANNPFKKTA